MTVQDGAIRFGPDLIVAVYRHQVEACAAAGPALLGGGTAPGEALSAWIDLFVDFLVTKHGLAEAMRSDQASFQPLHDYFLERLVPVCAALLQAAAATRQVKPGIDALGLMFAVGNLCIGAHDPRYDPREMVHMLIADLAT